MQETNREEIDKINRLMDLKDDISWAEERDSQNHVPPNDMKYMVDNCIELDEKGDLLVRVGALGGSPTARIREALVDLDNQHLAEFDAMIAARSQMNFSVDNMRIEADDTPGSIHSVKSPSSVVDHERPFSLEIEKPSLSIVNELDVPSQAEIKQNAPPHISVISRLADQRMEPDKKVAKALVGIYKDFQRTLTPGRANQVAYAVARHDPSGMESYRMSRIDGAPVEDIKAALKLENASSPYLAAMEPSTFGQAKSNHAIAQAEKPGFLSRLGGWISERKEQLSDSVSSLVGKVTAWARDNAIMLPSQATRVTIDTGDKLLIADGKITASLQHGSSPLEGWAFQKACRDAIESTGMNLKSVHVAEADLMKEGWSAHELVSAGKDHRVLPDLLTKGSEREASQDRWESPVLA